MPSEPSSQQDYALRCLSENNGTVSGSTKVGGIRIALHPLITDHTVYLEGRITAGTFKGKWYYQSYAGYDEFGSFDANAVKENIP